MTAPAFDKSVFINCPFDEPYEPILQAILFCVTYLGFTPRVASERLDSAENRLDKIREMIEGSAYSIHDLSRAQAKRKGEYYRLNMPFELGLDYGCRQYFGHGRRDKKILILEEKPHRYKASLSDLSGCDIQTHAANFEQAVRKVRNWLVNEAGAPNRPPAVILGKYQDFLGWYWDREKAAGASDEDIRQYPTGEVMSAMLKWIAAGEPL